MKWLRRSPASFALCMLGALLVAIPLWTHRWLPMQDLPQHLATMGIVHASHASDAANGPFIVDLKHTQYVIFYLVGDWLSYFMSVHTAGVLLITAYVLGLVASMYALLQALDRDPRLSLLLVPVMANTQFLIGLLQFLIGIPFMFYGWALAIRYRRAPSTRLAVGIAVIAVLIFYSHIVVFGLFGIGLAIMAPWRGIRRYALSLVPAGALCLHWAFFTESGRVVLDASTRGSQDKDLWAFMLSFHEAYDLVLNSYRDSADERLFLQAVIIAIVLTVAARVRSHGKPVLSTLRWLVIPAICLFLYFRSEGSNGYLAHIRDRFALLTVFTLVPALRMPRGWLGHAGAGALLVTAAMTAETFNWHCTQFERYEVADFEQALEQIPAGKHVAGLMFDTESKYFRQNPFLHFPTYYIVERGGTVNFSFAGYPHWAYRYRPHMDPLGASPPVFSWEWQPQRVAAREELAASYDYVITRGSGFDPPDALFFKAWEGTGWQVWKRRDHD